MNKNSMPKVSVLTPTFNSIETLPSCVDSVQMQKNVEVEHIVIDGGSTDNTVDFLQSKPQVLWISEKDRGVYDALNKGMNMSQGDFIAICHSDDTFIDQNFLSNAINKMSDENSDFYYADCFYISAKKPNSISRYYKSGNLSKKRLSLGLAPAHTTLIIRTSVARAIGLYDLNYPVCGDFEYFVRLCDRSYSYEEVPVVAMREGGISNFSWKTAISINRQLLRILRCYEIKSSVVHLLIRYPVKLIVSHLNLMKYKRN